jgi:hypothetical protein
VDVVGLPAVERKVEILELAQHGFGVDAYFGVAALGHVIGFLY